MTRAVRVLTAREAASLLVDGQTIATTGFTMSGVAEEIYQEIEARFLREGRPRDLTLLHSSGQSDRVGGMQHWAQPGLLARIIGSHWGLAPSMAELIANNGVSCHCLPQGQLAHLYRAIAGGQPGLVSTIGLHTFVDPRLEGGRVNARAQAEPPYVALTHLGEQEALWYRSVPIDIGIIRGSVADVAGNVSVEDEPLRLEVLALAQAVHNSGGKVVCQVKRLVERGHIRPAEVAVPGVVVDFVVVAERPDQTHRQTSSWFLSPPLLAAGQFEQVRLPGNQLAELDERSIIGRRVALEFFPNAIVNLGTGIPGDTVGPVLAAEGLTDDVALTIESGAIGGIPAGGGDFGVAQYPDAIIGHGEQFDFYNGGAVDVCCMGAGEIDARGNVNVSKLAGRFTGCGGFIDITQPARQVVFCATFSSGGLAVQVSDGQLTVLREGRFPKFVQNVAQVTFSAEEALRRKQTVRYVTERAVFELCAEGIRLMEVAPGVDVERDILARLPFRPLLADPVEHMSADIFQRGPLHQLRERFAQAKEAANLPAGQ